MKISNEYSFIEKVSENNQTPFYLYTLSKMAGNYKKLSDTFGAYSKIFYALKANPNPDVIKLFCNLGAGIVCSSAGEIKTAIKAGFSKKDIIFISPGKSFADLEYSICQDIGMIAAESLDEIKTIALISEKLGVNTGVGLRIRIPDLKVKAAEVYNDQHFGMAGNELEEAFKLINNAKSIYFKGFHFFPGTQILKNEIVINNFLAFLKVVNYFLQQCDYSIKLLVIFSAGLGVKYFENEESVSVVEISKEILQQCRPFLEQRRNIQLGIVSGRFLTADAGYYVVRIIDRKFVNGKEFIITDGGTHQISPSFCIGRYLKRRFPVLLLKQSSGESREVTITGNLCTPTDILASDIMVAGCSVGDLVVIPNTGAYGLTYSVLNFLSHKVPLEVSIWE